MNNSLNASAPGTNATVSASAGTGKTWLLVTRIVRLLLDGTLPGNILAITFTRKAAAEMQQRLTERLYEFTECSDKKLIDSLNYIEVSTDTKTCERARQLYESLLLSASPVTITTFHSFCQNLLRKFSLEADIPPGFALIEQTYDFQEEALESLFNKASNNPDSELAEALETLFIELNGLTSAKSALIEFLNHRSDWWAYTLTQTDPEKYATDLLLTQLNLNDPDKDVLADFQQSTKTRMLEFSKLLAIHSTKTNLKLCLSITNAFEKDQLSKNDFIELKKTFIKSNGEAQDRSNIGTLKSKLGDENHYRLIELETELANDCFACIENINLQHTYKINRAWYIAGNRLLELFQKIKQEQRSLDFNDLEWKTYLLLSQSHYAHWVQYKVDQRIDHILVDEFQDTNPTQWQFLLPLFEEMSSSETEKPRSVFLVGDEKQSIYRFRRAEPRLFAAASQWLTERLNAKTFPQDQSRRSSPAIMDFVNQVFADDTFPLPSFQSHSTFHEKLWGRVELLPLIETEKNDTDDTIHFRHPLEQPRIIENESDAHYREGRQMANKIDNLVSQNTIITDNGCNRYCRYDDILILVRTRSHIKDYEKALREMNIPYIGIDRGTLLDSIEIRDMMALLDHLTTPHNNQTLAIILKSPLFSCSDNDLMLLADKPANKSWYEQLNIIAPTIQADNPLRYAHKLLSQWHQLTGQLPVHDLLDRIYSEANVLARYQSASPDDLKEQVIANLMKFIELALEIDSGRYPSLSRFLSKLKYTRENKNESPDEGQRNSEKASVRLLTIHAAKGLESPVVFIADTESSNNDRFANKSLVDWPPKKSRPDFFMLLAKKENQDSISQQRIEQHRQAEEREKANLLYVAITRAKQLLFISGCLPLKRSGPGWYSKISSQLEMTGTEGEQTLLIESGTMPDSIKQQTEQAKKQDIKIDPRLCQAFKPVNNETNLDNTISPSQDSDSSASHTDGDIDGQIKGTIIHHLLDLISAGVSNKTDAMNQLSHHSIDKDQLEEYWQEATTLINDAQFKFLFDSTEYDKAYNEVPIQYKLNGKFVNGIIDRLVVNGDSVTIVDYKTHSDITEDNKEITAKQYQNQMALYNSGISQVWPEKTIQSLLVFTGPRLVHEFNQ